MNTSSELPLYIVDAFTKHPFKGNGAAICLVDSDHTIPVEIRQRIAAEMNLSETAFISVMKGGDRFDKAHKFKLQWFTPTCEVKLCGHATLASAAVLFNICGNTSEILEFETVSGILKASRVTDGKIEIDLPAYACKNVDNEYENLVKAVVGSLPVQNVVLSSSQKLLIQLKNDVTRQQLELLKPEPSELLACASNIAGVIVTLNASGHGHIIDGEIYDFDFISRYFAPWLGIAEDPVTGSAHSVLGPYWSELLGKKNLFARQCSPRGGNLIIKVNEDRVYISGDAVIVVEGKISF